MTKAGAIAGIIVGGTTVLIWQKFAWFGLYEIVPGFFLGMLAIIIVSKLSGKPSQAVLDDFDKFKKA
jgi:sodium/proline symporter